MSEWLGRIQFLTLTPDSSGLLDKILGLSLDLQVSDLRRLPMNGPRDGTFTAACLQRVTGLQCSRGSVHPQALKRLAKCPHLSGVKSITFHEAKSLPLGLITELCASSATQSITEIHLDGEEWIADDGSPVGDEHLAEFITRIGAAEKAARLTYLQLNQSIGPKTAQSLLDAPHLRPTERLCLLKIAGLNKAMKTALKKKFGKALRM